MHAVRSDCLPVCRSVCMHMEIYVTVSTKCSNFVQKVFKYCSNIVQKLVQKLVTLSLPSNDIVTSNDFDTTSNENETTFSLLVTKNRY